MEAEDAEVTGAYLLGFDDNCGDFTGDHSPKLKLALEKRKIIEEERERLHKVVQDVRMRNTERKQKTGGTQPKFIEDDPFAKYYLEIYRDLCGKTSINQITNEVFTRWKKVKRKPSTTLRKIHTNPHVTFGLAWELAVGERMNDSNQLKFALMKRKIVSEEIARLANFVRSMHKEKKHSIPFLKTYLKVFREMCGKSDITEIRGEAMRRYMTAKESKHDSKPELKKKKKSKKSLSTNHSSSFGKLSKLHECSTHGRSARKAHRMESTMSREKCLYHGSIVT